MRSLFSFLFIALFLNSVFATKTEGKSFTVKISGSGPAMFLIPGATCSAEIWDKTAQRYRDRYQVYSFDLAGYGGTAPIQSDNILPVIKEHLKRYIMEHADENSIVIGHSIGGFLTMWMAAEEKKWMSKIVIVDALPFLAAAQNPAMTAEIAKTAFANFKDYYMNMDDDAVEQNQRQILTGMIRNRDSIDFVLRQSIQSDRRTMGVTMYELMSTDLRNTIAAISVPALVLTSWDENYDTLIGMSKEKKLALYSDQYKLWKTASVKIIDDSRHFIMLDNPAALYKQVDAFLNNDLMPGNTN